ncbi:tyrosine-type recombinase/integrase [Shinella pollutisoli]|jgi:integrase|uniref:Tyrosine-type recombinase/integrase n=1 Tax=Shinella pollutisoli TaxID=2250594 RepID=A0ABV7DKX1_9HYPH|nr:hypothetical protein [Shinella pollutisoli]
MARRREPPRIELQAERKHRNGSVEKAVWVIKHFDEGKGRQAVISTGFGADEGADAQKYFAQWLVEKTSDQPVARNRDAGDVPVAEVLDYFIEERIKLKVGSSHRPLARPQEVLAYVIDLLNWWGKKTVAEVTRQNCQRYAEHCSTPTAGRNRLEYLRRAINLAQDDGILVVAPKVHLPPKPAARDEVFERDDIAKLMRHCLRRGTYTYGEAKSKGTGKVGQVRETKRRPHRHLMSYILMATYTGTRSNRMFTASFVREAGRPWIDLKRGIYHRAAPKEDVAPNKGAPTCKIPKRLLRHMRRWYMLGRRYPIEYNGKPIKSSKGLRKIIRELFPDKDLVPHSFRHTAATWLMRRSELSVHDISGFLGMSLEILDRTYGHHRVSHQSAIDDAISSGGIGKIEKDDPLEDEFNYGDITPLDTMRNNSNQGKSTRTKRNGNTEKSRDAA